MSRGAKWQSITVDNHRGKVKREFQGRTTLLQSVSCYNSFAAGHLRHKIKNVAKDCDRSPQAITDR